LWTSTAPLFNNSPLFSTARTSGRYIANDMANASAKEIFMNHFRILAIGTILAVTQFAIAQQPSTTAANSDTPGHTQQASPAMSPVEQHLQLLTERLGLTTNQQARIRPVLKQMLEDRQKLDQDTSLSESARQEKEKALHDKADKQARKFLSDDQKQKLDALEQQSHP
jgi:hypothetical protein